MNFGKLAKNNKKLPIWEVCNASFPPNTLKMQKWKKLLYLTLIFLIINIIFALEINQFSDSTTEKYINYQNLTHYFVNLSIPNNANISSAKLNITNWNRTICYQSQVNESTYCGASGEGNYSDAPTDMINETNVIDGNWTTWGRFSSSDGNVYMRYVVPNTNWRAIWEIKGGEYWINITINETCFNRGDELVLRGRSTASNTQWYCNNISHWVSLYLNEETEGYYYRLYEEAIHWNISGIVPNISINMESENIYQNNSVNKSTIIDLNHTKLQSYVNTCSKAEGGNCIITLNISEYNNASLIISNLNITYNVTEGALFFNDTTDWTGNYETTDSFAKVFTINSTKTVNQTNCNFNVSVVSLRDVLSQNETNFTIENQSLKTVQIDFSSPPAFDYSGLDAYLWVYCGLNKTGNINIEFVVTSPPAGTTTTTGGGGGGGTTIIISELGNFSMETDAGSGAYDIIAVKGSQLKKPVCITNLGADEIELFIYCLSEHEICSWVNLSQRLMTLPPNEAITKCVDVYTTVPETVEFDEIYEFSIIAERTDTGASGSLGFKITIGRYTGLILEAGRKWAKVWKTIPLKSKYFPDKDVRDIPIYYFIPILTITIIITLLLRLISKTEKFKYFLIPFIVIYTLPFIIITGLIYIPYKLISKNKLEIKKDFNKNYATIITLFGAFSTTILTTILI